MKCVCPKCHADVPLNLATVPEDGTSLLCPECKTRFFVYKESFACRALRKPGEITCRHCGSGLGHTQYCPSCGVVYPDYIYASIARKQVRKVREKFSLKESLFPGTVVRKSSSPKIDIKKPQAVKPQLVEKYRKIRTIAVGAMVLIALMAAGIYFYLQNEAKQQYAVDYVRALYGMKMGTEMGLKVCSKLSSDWKANVDAGRALIPRISADDETKLIRIKSAVDGVMKKSAKPPQTFREANEKLTGLYAAYQKIHSSAVAPSGSWAMYNGSISKLESDFKRAATELKGSLPKELADELKAGQLKYKGLRDF